MSLRSRFCIHGLNRKLTRAAHVMGPTLIALALAGATNVAHAQGTMDFSGAQTLMSTFKTFAMYAGAVICLGGLIFAGIRTRWMKIVAFALSGLLASIAGIMIIAQAGAASSFVTPALLGGNFAKMLGTLVEEQIMTVFDWPFGAAIATLLTVLVMIVNLASVWLVERRFPSRAAEGR